MTPGSPSGRDLPATLEEPEERARERVRLLTFVLCYDDLLAEQSQTLRLDQTPSLVLGRKEEGGPGVVLGAGALRLPDRFLSFNHATLTLQGEDHVLRDAGSKNGTLVNGAPIGEHTLDDGDLIEVGHSLLCYRVTEEPAARALLEARAAPRMGPTRTFCPEVALLWRDLLRVAPSTEPVLIVGQTGSGKEVAAAMIHELSQRSGALRAVDCGAVPEGLFESLFFGHRRGAFTGAAEDQPGEVLRAHRGTLFLDELANLSAASQAKLLRVIADGRVMAVGGKEPQAVDVRWVSAANRDLFAEDGPVRADLLRRLCGHVVRLPPLAQRREDLGALTAHLLRDAGLTRASITTTAARRLFCSRFPGNVRQLRSTLRRAALLCDQGRIEAAHCEVPDVQGSQGQPGEASEAPRRPPGRPEVVSALRATHGNVVKAAGLLGVHPRQVYRWIERFSLELTSFRA